MDELPFPDLKIDSPDLLKTLVGRSKCPKCNKSRKWYCYTCYVPVNEVKDKLPYVKLPVKVDVIKHPAERDGKSTSPHAGVLAPEDVRIYTYPCIPDYDKTKTVLVFPGENSVTLEQIAQEAFAQSTNNDAKNVENSSVKYPVKEAEESRTHYEPESKRPRTADCCDKKPDAPFEKVVFIDSTWSQSKKIFKDERLTGIRHVEMKSYITKFWRYQLGKPNTYLATIEAIYYFICEFHKQFVSNEYNGEYDNLLFFFNFLYHKIRDYYEGGEVLKAYGGTGDKGDLIKRRKKEITNEENTSV